MIFAAPQLTEKTLDVIRQIEALKQQLRYAVYKLPRWYGLLRRNVLAKAIQGSNSIEGYNVSRDDAVAAVGGEQPIEEKQPTWAAVMGYRKAMTYVIQLADDPYFRFSSDLLRSLHFMMLEYDLSKDPGKWRPGTIHVRNEATGQIVYEGPPADQVPGLMEELVQSLAQPSHGMPCVVRAALAHLNLAMIHPFRDGNGRMARCLQTLVLAREGTVAPEFSSIEEYLGEHTQAYYAVLGEVGVGHWNPDRDTRPWIHFCLTAHYQQAMRLLRREREMSKIWSRLEDELKQRGLLERMIFALMDGAYGYRITNARYRSNTDVSDQVASRDLKRLVDLGLLVAQGKARGRYYGASEWVVNVRNENRETKTLENPFN
jgi:Fic family protein